MEQEMRYRGIFVIHEEETFVRFTEAGKVGPRYKIGQVIKGEVPDDVLRKIAQTHPVQLASIVADEAAVRCEEAKKKFELDEITQAEVQWACTRAQLLALYEQQTWLSRWLETQPDRFVVEWLTEQLASVNEQIALLQLQLDTLRAEGYERPEFQKLSAQLDALETGITVFEQTELFLESQKAIPKDLEAAHP